MSIDCLCRFCVSLTIILFLGACQPKNQANDYLESIIAVENYLRANEIRSESGLAWQVFPDLEKSHIDRSLYSGTPGIVMFYIQAHRISGNQELLERAIGGSAYLLNHLPDTLPGNYQLGLFTGISGQGFCFIEMFHLTGDEVYRKAAERTVDIIEMASSRFSI